MESLLYVQESVQFLMRVKGHSSHLFFMAVCASVESSKNILGDKQGLSGGDLAAVSKPKSGTVAWQII